MTRINMKSLIGLAVISIFLTLTAGGAFADKPSWAGGGKHKEGKGKHEERERGDQGRDRDGDRQDGTVTFGFGSYDRHIVTDYYGTQMRKGKCPPGLAKKGNGCQPPGQAKKWKKGYPLRDVTYYELPRTLIIRLPAPPPNHRYVQVAGDILMIAVGTNMVVDAIEDIFH